jgi:N-methylhydantoinase A
MRMSCDTGGTFTDLVVQEGSDILLFKSPTTPTDPAGGILNAIGLAAEHFGLRTSQLLEKVDVFMHATTRSLNAVLTGNVARTAFLTTRGHPDVLVIREGGRADPFDYSHPYPAPYVPRALTFEVPERIGADGSIVEPLDEGATVRILSALKEKQIEAIGVCFLWSISNGAHEKRAGELIARVLPDVPFTLSHELNPTLREYRRASAACMDASLKPMMHAYLKGLRSRLESAGFSGRLLMVTSQGGVMDASATSAAPIHALNSGPSMAPVAGRYYARRDAGSEFAIVADTGGTSYDVSIVRNGRIPRTKETWIGQPFQGHMTGFPSVDVTSVGAGGGSIAWVDEGGLLHVGPQSAAAVPGPACYNRGGTQPTVTDCSLILGHIDPQFFLGGRMGLHPEAAREALESNVASKLGVSIEEAALAVLALTTEKMVGAIEDIAIAQGIDTSTAALIGGGGAGGLNAGAVARRLGCSTVLIPETGATLSAVGALMSDLYGEFTRIHYMTSLSFQPETAIGIVEELRARCLRFIDEYGQSATSHTIEFAVEARYPKQIWEIEIPLTALDFYDRGSLNTLITAFHAEHRALFQISDDNSGIEIIAWRAFVRCQLGEQQGSRSAAGHLEEQARRRNIYLPTKGWTPVPVWRVEAMKPDQPLVGPAIVESPFTTVVIDEGAVVARTQAGGLRVQV